jgi:hypothetical protein
MLKVYSHWKDFPMSKWRWKDFSPQEMACRGTGKLAIDPDGMDKLQALRDLLGSPMIINSAYRSPEHNRAVGGAKQSEHLKANAWDVRMDNHDPDRFIAAALKCGFNGIGTYPRQNFIHIDGRSYRANWGKPFAKREATPDFAPEQPHEPETAKEDPETKGILTGIGGTTLVGAGGVLSGMGKLDPMAQTILSLAGFILVVGVFGYLLRKRLRRLAG